MIERVVAGLPFSGSDFQRLTGRIGIEKEQINVVCIGFRGDDINIEIDLDVAGNLLFAPYRTDAAVLAFIKNFRVGFYI